MKNLVRRFRVSLLILELLTGGAMYAAGADPFTVTLPDGYGPFTRQTQNVKSPDGDIVTTNWISKAPTGEAVIVTLSKMPAKILDPAKLTSSTRASLLKALHATEETENTFRSEQAVFRVRLTAKDDELYQVLYVGRSDAQRSAAPVASMFESFSLRGDSEAAGHVDEPQPAGAAGEQ